jgi:hypothetical protein
MSAISTKDVKVGDILHDVHTYKMGNTTMTAEGHWTADVTAVAEDGTWAEASWNSNPAKRYVGCLPKGWKRAPKDWIRQGLGGGRACALCCASEKDGHTDDCDHPRAVAKRKAAAKAAKP